MLLELHNPACDRAAWKYSERFAYEVLWIETGRIAANVDEVHGTLLCKPRRLAKNNNL
jgi:hypothetical protein